MSDTDPADDPARRFLDQTVPREDQWDGREPQEGPARPRHVQYPAEPQPLPDPRERRKNAVRNTAWTFGPTLAYLAATALSGDGDAQPAPPPDPPPPDAPPAGEIGSAL